MRTEEPRPIHLKDYRPADFRISTIDLDFVLTPENTRVAAKMRMQRTGDSAAPLVLNGTISEFAPDESSAHFEANRSLGMVGKQQTVRGVARLHRGNNLPLQYWRRRNQRQSPKDDAIFSADGPTRQRRGFRKCILIFVGQTGDDILRG